MRTKVRQKALLTVGHAHGADASTVFTISGISGIPILGSSMVFSGEKHHGNYHKSWGPQTIAELVYIYIYIVNNYGLWYVNNFS